ncbi:MAG TPA: hypothetical protein VJ746_05515 [Nitrospira sp.]|nr:hypothetical protein [Nitrospira sp.]
MQGGKETAGFDVLWIEGEQFLQCCGGPAVFAGIHVSDGFFKEGALLTVADDTLSMPGGGVLLVGLVGGGSLVSAHASTLADAVERQLAPLAGESLIVLWNDSQICTRKDRQASAITVPF